MLLGMLKESYNEAKDAFKAERQYCPTLYYQNDFEIKDSQWQLIPIHTLGLSYL